MRSRLHVVLFQPQIPWNTGNVGRTCLAFGVKLHLVNPNFSLDSAKVKRAGLDYWPSVDLVEYSDWESFENTCMHPNNQIFFFSKMPKLGERSIFEVDFVQQSRRKENCSSDLTLVFGSETTGLTDIGHRIQELAHKKEPSYGGAVYIPQDHTTVRSLNLSTAVALGIFEVQRQYHMIESLSDTRGGT
jgi:tRNA (cytidine/uridine-2'-O-)-methyltransferase